MGDVPRGVPGGEEAPRCEFDSSVGDGDAPGMEEGEESVEGYQYAGSLRAQVQVSCAESEPTDPSSSATCGKRGKNVTTKRATTVEEAVGVLTRALHSHGGSQSSPGRCRLRAALPRDHRRRVAVRPQEHHTLSSHARWVRRCRHGAIARGRVGGGAVRCYGRVQQRAYSRHGGSGRDAGGPGMFLPSPSAFHAPARCIAKWSNLGFRPVGNS